MRVSDDALDEVRSQGYTVVEQFLSGEELDAAREALWLHYPTPEQYFSDPAAHVRFAGSQFAGVEEFSLQVVGAQPFGISP